MTRKTSKLKGGEELLRISTISTMESKTPESASPVMDSLIAESIDTSKLKSKVTYECVHEKLLALSSFLSIDVESIRSHYPKPKLLVDFTSMFSSCYKSSSCYTCSITDVGLYGVNIPYVCQWCESETVIERSSEYEYVCEGCLIVMATPTYHTRLSTLISSIFPLVVGDIIGRYISTKGFIHLSSSHKCCCCGLTSCSKHAEQLRSHICRSTRRTAN